MRKKGTAKV
jgi:hypothetical protein